MLLEIDEKQITWQNLIETVVSDRLDEDVEPTIEVGIDLALDDDITAITEFYRGQIIRAFVISEEQFDEVRTFFQSLECEVNWRHAATHVCGSCTPSRYPITGGNSEGL